MGEEIRYGPGVLYTADGRMLGEMTPMDFKIPTVTMDPAGDARYSGPMIMTPLEMEFTVQWSLHKHRRMLAALIGWRAKGPLRLRMLVRAARMKKKAVIF